MATFGGADIIESERRALEDGRRTLEEVSFPM
jgi:hypothetical protein